MMFALWCMFFVSQFVSTRAAFFVRDEFDDANPWALALAFGALAATARLLWTVAR